MTFFHYLLPVSTPLLPHIMFLLILKAFSSICPSPYTIELDISLLLFGGGAVNQRTKVAKMEFGNH